MSWDEIHRQEQQRRREDDRLRRDKELRDQQRQQHEDAMRQQTEHFRQLRHNDRDQAARDPRPSGGAPLSVWFFGGIGALFGGVNPPPRWDGFMGAVLGFLVGGFLGGYLRQFAWGRALLWIVGLGFVGLMAFAIYRS